MPIMVGVGAIIEDGTGQILLAKHRPERGGFWQGKWICPGGELELGETIEAGIKREVKEETQLDIELIEPVCPFERIVKSKDRVALHVIYIDYRARVTGGVLKPGSDIGEAIWVKKDSLPQKWDELHEDTKRLLRLAKIVE